MKSKRDETGRIVGWEGRCAVCGQVAELPVKQFVVAVGRPARC